MKYRVLENIFLLAIPCEIREANLSGSAVRLIISWNVCSLEMELTSALILEFTELSL